jgi:hypothetical protein
MPSVPMLIVGIGIPAPIGGFWANAASGRTSTAIPEVNRVRGGLEVMNCGMVKNSLHRAFSP